MLLGRIGLSPVMVGRDAELSRLRSLISTGPDPQVALVAGEAGIGKTRLVTHELTRHLPADAQVLVGGAVASASGRPFAVLLDAVEPVVATWDRLPDRLVPFSAELTTLLGPLAARLDLETGRPPVDGARRPGPDDLARTAVELVRSVAGSGDAPTLLVFDDLHWADAESIHLFGRLAMTPGLAVVLVGTYRPEEVFRRDRLAALLVDLERLRNVVHVDLRRLDRAQVGQLLAAVYSRPVPWSVADAVHRRTAGNPFFVEELVLAAGDASPEELAALPLPWTLSETVLRHLDGLDADSLRVVDAAAVLGRRIPFDLLAAITGSDEDALIDVLRQLVDRGLLVEDEADVFTFRHALTHEAVEARLLSRERRRLHAKALTALEASGSNDEVAMAHHAEAAGCWDEMVVAARRGARRQLETTCGSAATALHLAEMGLGEAEDDAELHHLAARAAWQLGAMESAIAHASAWAAAARAGGRTTEDFQARSVVARLEWEAGRASSFLDAVQAVLALAESLGPSPELALACAMKSEALMVTGESGAAVEWADRSLAVGADVGDDASRARALANKGAALTDQPGGFEEGCALIEQAIHEAEATGDGLTLGRSYFNLVAKRAPTWPLEKTKAVLAEALSKDDSPGWTGTSTAVLHLIGYEVAELEGDMAQAEQAVADALRASDGLPRGQWGSWYHGIVADLAVERDDLVAAEGALEARRRLGPRSGFPGDDAAVWMPATAAAVAGRKGDSAGAAAALADLAKASVDDGASGRAVQITVLAALAADVAADEVRAAMADIRPSRHECANHLDRAGVHHIQAALLAAGGDNEAAVAEYRQALADTEVHRAAWLVADARTGLARSHASAGRRIEAKAEADAVVSLLGRWPGWRRDDAEALARRLSRGGASEGTLTPRENEVAALVAEGLSNGEIARRLYISTKTASVHVSNILLKLGMSNRAEVAAWAVRTGVAGP